MEEQRSNKDFNGQAPCLGEKNGTQPCLVLLTKFTNSVSHFISPEERQNEKTVKESYQDCACGKSLGTE